MISLFIRGILNVVSLLIPFPINLPVRWVVWFFRLFVWWL